MSDYDRIFRDDYYNMQAVARRVFKGENYDDPAVYDAAYEAVFVALDSKPEYKGFPISVISDFAYDMAAEAQDFESVRSLDD